MREFTPEEKERIINTEITRDCFDMDNYFDLPCDLESEDLIIPYLCEMWSALIRYLEFVRKKYNQDKDENYFIELVRLLPNTYKVVKL